MTSKSTNKTAAHIAAEILRESGNSAIGVGDSGLLHQVAERLGVESQGVLTERQMLDSIDRSHDGVLIKRYESWPHRGGGRTRRFWLPEAKPVFVPRENEELPPAAAETFPVKPGDWIQDTRSPEKVAIVRNVYRDPSGGPNILVDIYLYSKDGDRIGRESPACGGPRKFEPACTYTGVYVRISEPKFPVRHAWVDIGNGKKRLGYTNGATVQPDRQWVKPRRKLRRTYAPPAAPAPSGANLDPAAEASALRRSAQELRDAARELTAASDADALRARAKRLEKEAEALSPQFQAPA